MNLVGNSVAIIITSMITGTVSIAYAAQLEMQPDGSTALSFLSFVLAGQQYTTLASHAWQPCLTNKSSLLRDASICCPSSWSWRHSLLQMMGR